MNAVITPTVAIGEISSISSKSAAHRLLICAALSDKKTSVRCTTINKDISATVACLNAMGAEICYDNGSFSVIPITEKKDGELLLCNESGSTLRFLIPVACALGGSRNFLMEGRLPERPISPLKEELEAKGIKFTYTTQSTCYRDKKAQR